MTEAAVWRVLARGVILAFSLWFTVFLVGELRTVIIQLLLAVIISAAASPLVNVVTASERSRLWRWRIGRGVATVLVFLTVVLLFALVALAVGGALAPDLARLAANLPSYAARVQTGINELLARYPELASQVGIAAAGLQLQDLLSGAVGLLAQAPRVVGFATDALSLILRLLFTLILALYLTADGDRIRRYVIQLLPFDRHAQALRVSEHMGLRLGAWARGQIVLSAIVGAMTWLAALVLGLPYAGALTLIAAVGELVPNLGPFIAAIPLVAVALLTSPTQGLLALGFAVLIQQLENNLVAPRVMGQAVELHPLVVMVAILAGNELLGIVGALLAVPVAASLAVVIDEIQHERLARHFGIQETDEQPAA